MVFKMHQKMHYQHTLLTPSRGGLEVEHTTKFK